MRPRMLGRLGLLGAAAVGAIFGHCLTYVLAVWDEGSRHALMIETGHGYWNVAVSSAVVIGIWLVGAVILRQLRPDAPRPSERTGIWGLTLRLAILQVVLFASMEAGERLLTGAPLEGWAFHGLLSFGSAVQAVVALAIALILRLLVRAAEVLASVLSSRRPTTAEPVPRPTLRRPLRPVAVLAGGGGVRGPPLLR